MITTISSATAGNQREKQESSLWEPSHHHVQDESWLSVHLLSPRGKVVMTVCTSLVTLNIWEEKVEGDSCLFITAHAKDGKQFLTTARHFLGSKGIKKKMSVNSVSPLPLAVAGEGQLDIYALPVRPQGSGELRQALQYQTKPARAQHHVRVKVHALELRRGRQDDLCRSRRH
jgi:hypothetical protein